MIVCIVYICAYWQVRYNLGLLAELSELIKLEHRIQTLTLYIYMCVYSYYVSSKIKIKQLAVNDFICVAFPFMQIYIIDN